MPNVTIHLSERKQGNMARSARYLQSLERLMAPRSVAIVGASESGTGRMVVENFLRLPFDGQLVAVNPKYKEVLGFPCFPSLEEISFIPDVAVLSVARERVLPILYQAADKGVSGVIVFALGFNEGDDLGREWETRLVDVANGAGMALLGPNCQGFVDFQRQTALYMDTVYPYDPGHVALVAESGSVLTSLLNNKWGARWSHAISCGNEAVTTAADVLSYLVELDGVTAVCAELETIRDVDVFVAACERALELEKSVVVCATGQTPESQAAVTAHTGALALPARLLKSTLQRHGVAVTESMEELLETAIAIQSPKRPAGGRLAVLAPSGGHIEFFHDNVARTHLSVPEFSDSTVRALEGVLPPLLHARNPLDWWGMADPDKNLPQLLKAVSADDSIDIILQSDDFTCGPTGDERRALGALSATLKVKDDIQKPFVLLDSVSGTPSAADVERGLSDGIVVLSGFGTGLQALSHLVARWRPRPRERQARPAPAVRPIWRRCVREIIAGPDALDLLESAGIAVVKRVAASTPENAVSLAKALNYPVVVKSGEAELAHKTELGAVLLGLSTPEEVYQAATKILSAGAGQVLIEEQLTDGIELLIGLETRPPLGQFIAVGLGGIWAEVFDDVQIRPVGLREGEAEEMVRSLRALPLLSGARGTAGVDIDAVVEAVERLDDLALELGQTVKSIDINPLIAMKDRAIAVDSLFLRRL